MARGADIGCLTGPDGGFGVASRWVPCWRMRGGRCPRTLSCLDCRRISASRAAH